LLTLIIVRIILLRWSFYCATEDVREPNLFGWGKLENIRSTTQSQLCQKAEVQYVIDWNKFGLLMSCWLVKPCYLVLFHLKRSRRQQTITRPTPHSSAIVFRCPTNIYTRFWLGRQWDSLNSRAELRAVIFRNPSTCALFTLHIMQPYIIIIIGLSCLSYMLPFFLLMF